MQYLLFLRLLFDQYIFTFTTAAHLFDKYEFPFLCKFT